MNDLISRKALEETMYEEVFLKDSDDQRWDSGCWIRYKMFENALSSAPTIDAVPVVRCKDCKHNLHPGKPNSVCGLNIPIFDGNGFCSEGERKDDV